MNDSSSGNRAVESLESASLADLHNMARDYDVPRYRLLRRGTLIERIKEARAGTSAALVRPAEEVDSEDVGPVDSIETWTEVAEALAREEAEERQAGREPDTEAAAEEQAEDLREDGEAADRAESTQDSTDGVESAKQDSRRARPRNRRSQRSPRTRRETAPSPESESGSGSESEPEPEPIESRSGTIEIRNDGAGILRAVDPSVKFREVLVSQAQVKKLGLRSGDEVSGPIRRSRRGERYDGLRQVESVNGREAGDGSWIEERPRFDRLGAVPPTRRISLDKEGDLVMRGLDLVAPLGFGDRLVVGGPPGSAVTEVLRAYARGFEAAAPDGETFVFLVDSRPEDVTGWRTTGATVVSCGPETQPQRIVSAVGLALSRAARLAETGRDAVVVIDSLTRLAEVYMLSIAARDQRSGADLEGTRWARSILLNGRALEEPGGTLTLMTAVRNPGSSPLGVQLVDDAIEVADTDVRLAQSPTPDAGLPAIAVGETWTRHLGALTGTREIEARMRLRESLVDLGPREAADRLLDILASTKSNDAVLGQD